MIRSGSTTRTVLALLCVLSVVLIVDGGRGILTNTNYPLAAKEPCTNDDLRHFLSGHNIRFPCKSTKNIFESSGRYEPKFVIATRMQIGRDHAFIALPRFKPGVPLTLARVHLQKTACTTELEPYPCWAMQEEGDCDSLQSVVDLVLDNQEILWVLDTGIVNTLQQPVRRCHPKIVAIDTRSGRVVKRIDLSDVVTSDSRLQHLLVDYDPRGHPYM